MKKSNLIELSRRDLFTKIMPVCAATCVFPDNILSTTEPKEKKIYQQTKHKFDTETTITYRELFRRQFFNIILFAKLLKEELGDKQTIELIKKLTYKDGLELGKRRAEQQRDNGLQTFVERFKDPERYKHTLTKEVAEDSEKAFELKVTECIWATTCLQQNAGDIGFAWICYADYAVPQGFNPKIEMVRDKTLMQGHDCCNHRYIWTG